MTTSVACVLAIWLAAGGFGQQSADPRVIASNKDWSITSQQFEQILESLPEQARGFFLQNRRDFLDQLIRMWVIAAEAKEKGVDKTGKLKAQVEFYGNNLAAREYTRQLSESSKVTDDAIAAFYKASPGDFTQVKLSHILILNGDSPVVRGEKTDDALTHDEAMKKIAEVKTKMQGGAKFEDLAKEYSQDPGSAANGGDLGFISKGQLVEEVEKVAFSMKADTYSEIVESPFGFHILHVTEIKVAPLEEVRATITQKLSSEELDRQIEGKVKAAGVQIDESFFK